MTAQLDMFVTIPPDKNASPGLSRARHREPLPSPLTDEDMVGKLEASGRYRILRKLVPRQISSVRRAGFPHIGVILDTETTGLDHRADEIIELGVISFAFNDRGDIGEIIGLYGGLQQPTVSIPPEITRLTGIDDEMVRDKIIDMRPVRSLIEPADLIIAHNAGFDRPFCEALAPVFSGKAWACSVLEIDWQARGFEGTKLGYLVGQAGLFHDGHRAVDDCFALLEVLDRASAHQNTPFAELLCASQQSRVRIFAEHSPFEMKDHLKKRGYRWSDGSDGRPKSWWIELEENALDDELRYLRSEVYGWEDADPPVQHLSAFDRFKA